MTEMESEQEMLDIKNEINYKNILIIKNIRENRDGLRTRNENVFLIDKGGNPLDEATQKLSKELHFKCFDNLKQGFVLGSKQRTKWYLEMYILHKEKPIIDINFFLRNLEIYLYGT